jgi:hypothetical protein
MPAYYHDYLQNRAMGMNEIIKQGKDVTAGLNSDPRWQRRGSLFQFFESRT